MGRDGIQVGLANDEEIAGMEAWYALGETDPGEMAVELPRAYRAGYLATDLVGGMTSTTPKRMLVPPLEAFLARSAVFVARHDDTAIGALVLTPLPARLIVPLVASVDPALQGQAMASLLRGPAKIDLVVVAPDHRGIGLGSRLISRAIKCARESAFSSIYGQFRFPDPYLEAWYARQGFSVEAPGAPWFDPILGVPIYTAPTEQLFGLFLN